MTDMTTKQASNIRLFCGRDCDGMVQKLENAVVNGKTVSLLEIRETALEDDVMDSIVNLLSKVSVKTVHLEDCWAMHTNQSAIRLVTALGNCPDVRLSESTFLSKFFLEPFLESATQLKNLRIRGHLLVDQVEALSRGLASNKFLDTLDLSRSRIDDFGCLAEGLRGGCVKNLKLRSIGLRDRHLKKLMLALQSASSPTSMSPTSTSSSAPSSSPLSSSPMNSAAISLESLDLSFNRLRKFKYIMRFLKHPECNLKELLIGYQNLWQPTRNGMNINVSQITDALSHNTRLTTLKLPRNELGDSDAFLFATALEENDTLEILDLRENNISDEGVIALVQAAKYSKALIELQLKGNPFGKKGSLALLDAVSNNYNLFFLGDMAKDESKNDTKDKNASIHWQIHSQIRYQAALNRGGRKLLVGGENENEWQMTAPLGLWPLVLEKQTRGDDCMRFDALYYLLREGSTTFFPSKIKTR